MFFKGSVFDLRCPPRLCSWTTTVYSVYHTTKLTYPKPQVYLSLSTGDADLSLKLLGERLGDISGRNTNNKLRLNANKTDFITIGTSRQRSKLTHFFPTNILSHSITPSDTVRNLVVTVDSEFNFRNHNSEMSLLLRSYS